LDQIACKPLAMTDFIIIGGGVAGTSAGAALSRLGTVTLLEAETALAYHASGRSAALFEESYGQPSSVALNKASHDYHLTHDLLTPRGLMAVGTADTVDAFHADQAQMNLTSLSPAQAKDIVPILNTDVVTHAAWHTSAWDLDTDRMIQTYVKTIRSNGGAVHTNAAATGILRTENGWTVKTAKGDFRGAILVNAAGPWVDQIAALAGITTIGFSAYRRSMGRIPAPAGHDLTTWPMIFGAGETWYCKPDAGALVVSPAEEHLMDPHDAYTDDMVLAEGFARYEAHMTEPVTRLLSSWAGLRTFSPDRTLVLGPDPADPSFIWCAGQGGYGMQSSPAAGQLIADLVNATPPCIDAGDVAALHPARFR
jgi:glycine/D-amino acid oxidase-like deaminating enzyme